MSWWPEEGIKNLRDRNVGRIIRKGKRSLRPTLIQSAAWKRDVCWQLTVSFTIKIRPYSSSTANIFLDDCGLMAVEGYGLDSEGVTRLLLENLESRVLPLLS